MFTTLTKKPNAVASQTFKEREELINGLSAQKVLLQAVLSRAAGLWRQQKQKPLSAG
jgi:hypothetical protein